VCAPEVEAVVCEALRRENSSAEGMSDKDLVAQHVGKVIIRRDRIEVELQRNPDREELNSASKLVIPFAPAMTTQKGIAREPVENNQTDAIAREKLLNAIRRASRWVEAVRSGEAKSFDQIAAQEGLGVRHARWLTPLAFLSPELVSAIINEAAPAGLTIATLAKALPHSWSAQKESLGARLKSSSP
jgi:hypothetical protein